MKRLFSRTALTGIMLIGLIAVMLSGCTTEETGTTTTTTAAETGTTAATSTPAKTATSTTTASSSSGSGTGTIAVYVTDAPPDEEITAVLVTVSGLRIHKAEAEQEQQQDGTGNATQERQNGDGGEWINISITGNMTTFDLLQFRDVTAFFGSANVSAGLYTQVRLVVESAQVSTADNVTRDATVSSGEIKIVRPFDIIEGETTELLLDFDAEQSVHFTGNGKVMIKPVIKLSIDAKHRSSQQSGEEDEDAGDEEEDVDEETEAYCFSVSCEEFQATSAITGNITLPLGETLAVSLCSNATTGYQWNEDAVFADNVTLVQASHGYIEPGSGNGNGNGQVGTAGTEQWTFDTLAAGTTTIYFEYGQPWEGGEKAAWTLELTVTVE